MDNKNDRIQVIIPFKIKTVSIKFQSFDKKGCNLAKSNSKKTKSFLFVSALTFAIFVEDEMRSAVPKTEKLSSSVLSLHSLSLSLYKIGCVRQCQNRKDSVLPFCHCTHFRYLCTRIEYYSFPNT